jgi:hypothetical protein
MVTDFSAAMKSSSKFLIHEKFSSLILSQINGGWVAPMRMGAKEEGA